jgi:Tfp pilus assembly protein PilX
MAVPNRERGFVLPAVLGVGLVMILLGVMMIERSSQNRITAAAQRSSDRSLAAAENGLTQLQVLFNRYRFLATACSNKTLSPACDSEDSVPWSNLSNAVLEPCSTSPTDPITLVQDYASQNWHNVSANPEDGQFRLISYQYQPTDNTQPQSGGNGTLIVEGRVNPDDSIRTARAQLKTAFKVTRESGLGNSPGLWVQQNQTVTNAGSVQLLTHVRDSTCPGDPASSNPVQQLQSQVQSPYTYQPIPGIPFPELPLGGSSLPTMAQPKTDTIESIDSGGISLPPSTAGQADPQDETDTPKPSPTSPVSPRTLTYHVKAKNGRSINLNSPLETLTIGTGTETIVLDLEGGLNVTEGGKIKLVSGSTLIIYAHGPVTLAASGTTPAIEQEDTPSASRTQIYVYSSPSPLPAYPVSLRGNAAPLYLTLFAPTSTVTSSAQVQGSVWAKSWEGLESAVVRQDPMNVSDLKLLWPPRISPITEWKRQESS